MAGGRNFALNDAYESAELYSPLTETFTHTGSMTDGRWSHTATRLADGRVLVAGRFTDPATSANDQPVLTSAELYNPATTHVVADRPMTTRRALHVAEALPDGRVLVAGGRTCHAPPPTACNSDFTTETGRDLQPGHRHVDAGGQHEQPPHDDLCRAPAKRHRPGSRRLPPRPEHG